MKRIFLLAVSFGIALALIVACTQAATPTTQAPPLEEETQEEPTIEPEVEDTADDDVEELINMKCSGCHSVDRVFRADKTEAEWETTINRMINLGADVTEEEQAQIIEWLVSRED